MHVRGLKSFLKANYNKKSFLMLDLRLSCQSTNITSFFLKNKNKFNI